MNFSQTIYCERGMSAALLAEPINAVTNLSFVMAAFLAYRFLKQNNGKDKELFVLPWLLMAIGVGSFVYHTARSSITVIFDGLPIYIYILFALYLMLKELMGDKIKSIFVLVGFIALEIGLSLYVPKDFFNGSIRHVAAIVFIVALGWFIVKKYGSVAMRPLVWTVSLYALAITFRSIDMIICPFFSIGTHFLWHILNGCAAYWAIILVSGLSKQNSYDKML